MNPLDVLLGYIVLFFVILGLYRGFFREILSLLGFILGLYLALHFYAPLAHWALQWFSSFPALVNVFSFVIIFLATVLLAAVVGVIFKKLIIIADLKVTDRLLGGLFGLTKAFLINALIVIFLVAFAPQGEKLVRNSPLAKTTQRLTQIVLRFAPPELKHKFFNKWQKINSVEERHD
jgi:membrane protein required for colicin V production